MKLEGVFQKQKIMRKLFISLIPILLMSTYFFGLRVIVLCLINILVAVLIEKLFLVKTKRKISEAVFITAILFTCTLPPNIPIWISIIGISFGMIFGKMVFGGFGKNIFNPALVGRAFIYVSFAGDMTQKWQNISDGFIGGFSKYLSKPIDVLTMATPLTEFRNNGIENELWNVFIGKIPGSIGETSALLIIIVGIYLIISKTASKEIILSYLLCFLLFDWIMYLFNIEGVPSPVYGLLTGGVLFGIVFMATDPISAPKEKVAKVIYGITIGILTVIIRTYALFAGGVMFAILIGNIFSPIFDLFAKWIKTQRIKVVSR